MKQVASPLRLAIAGVALLAVVAIALWLTPSNRYLRLPDPAHPAAHVVKVQGEKHRDGPGGIFFVDVIERRATLLERLFPSLRHAGSTLLPASAVRVPGISERAQRAFDLRAMARSQDVAGVVALRQLGYRVTVSRTGVAVAAVVSDTPADGRLHAGDVIVSADGERVRTPSVLRRVIGRHTVGERVRLTVRHGSGVRALVLKTVPDPDEHGHPIIGIIPEQAAQIRFPIGVRIDTGDIGGPSAGLAFALDIVDELGRDIDRGHRIAATGQLELDGRVYPIGGVRQKVVGAEEAHCDVFVVPAGDNAREARRYARGMRVLAVDSFQQALRKLATLPPAR